MTPPRHRLRSTVRGRPNGPAGAGVGARSPLSRRSSPCSSACRSSRSSPGRSSTGHSRQRSPHRSSWTRSWLSLVTTAISLVITVALGLPLAFVLARRQFRGKGWLEAIVDLPIVLPPSVAGLALLLVFGRQGPALRAVRIPRHLGAVHDDRRDPRPDIRLRPVLHPLGSDRHRECRPRLRGCGPSRWSLGTPVVPLRDGSPRERGSRGWPGDGLGPLPRRVRGDDHVRREHRRPDADTAAGRLRRSSRAASSTPRSPRRRSWSSQPLVS